MTGKYLDLTSGDDPRGVPSGTSKTRRFLGVHFVCCDVYSRVYLNHNETAYAGNCPRCAKQVRFRIGPGGTGARFFTVS